MACGDWSPEPPEATSALTAASLDSLTNSYPRLEAGHLPPPTADPSATPDEIPDRVAEALTDEAIERVSGEATYYADHFEGRLTASGIPFRQNQMVAAHRSYPFGTILRVTNLRNGRSVNVRVVDRGPFGRAAERGGILDLSRRAAERLDFVSAGRARVDVEVREWGDGLRS